MLSARTPQRARLTLARTNTSNETSSKSDSFARCIEPLCGVCDLRLSRSDKPIVDADYTTCFSCQISNPQRSLIPLHRRLAALAPFPKPQDREYGTHRVDSLHLAGMMIDSGGRLRRPQQVAIVCTGTFGDDEDGRRRAIRHFFFLAGVLLAAAVADPSPAIADCRCGSKEPDNACTGRSVRYEVSGSRIGFEFRCGGGDCRCGQFANEHDFWVAPITDRGEVVITRMTPDRAGSGVDTKNGAEVDPTNTASRQGLSGAHYYDASMSVDPPYRVDTGSVGRPVVILKARSNPENSPGHANCNEQRMCLDHVETLTVVPSPPGDVFRPPYFGTEKPMIPLSLLDESVLPSLKSAGGEASYADALASTTSVPFDHFWNWNHRERMHPRLNYGSPRNGYDGSIGQKEIGAYLKLLVLPPSKAGAAKRRLLARRVAQRGIDYYHVFKNGGQDNHPICGGWYGTGGYGTGKLPAILLANALLGQQQSWGRHLEAVLSTEAGRKCFAETSLIRPARGVGKNVPLFGHMTTHSGSKTAADPRGLVDGGGNAASTCISPYQSCCTTAIFRGGAMVVNLVPEIDRHLPSGARHWIKWVDRVTTKGAYCDADSWETTRYLDKEHYKVPGADALFFKYRKCAESESCSEPLT